MLVLVPQGCRRRFGVEWEARVTVGQRRGAGAVIVDRGLQPDDGATLGVSGSGWRKHIVVLGISQIITNGEHIPSHLARLDARERGNRAREIQRVNLPTARDRHDFGRGRGGGRILGDLTTASELARGMRGKRGSGANGGVDLSGGGRGVIGFAL